MKPSDLIADPAKWTKGAYARDAKGERLADNCDPAAVSWCVVGAIRQCCSQLTTGESDGSSYARLLNHLGTNVSQWNDAPERTHSEVIAALKACDL